MTQLRERAWRWGSRLTVVVGLLCAVARWGWATPLAEVLVFAFCAGLIAAGILAGDGLSAARRVTRIAIWTGAMVTAVGGLIAVLGVTAVVLLVGLVAVSPAIRLCIDHRWFMAATASESATADPPTPPRTPLPQATVERRIVEEPPLPRDLGSLDDAALCLAWRRSFPLLEAARTVPDRTRLVAQRQLYLDEMQRRCPSGVAAWLASGARASSNPLRFLREGATGPAPPRPEPRSRPEGLPGSG